MIATEDKTAWEIHTREAKHARLRSLTDSINDTARMARNSLSLLLIVALYLFLTLISSTDENLLHNRQVVLPQVGGSISVAQSYIFAPLIFLYLHAQLLFQLTVLAGKVRTFEVALKEEFPDTVAPNMQEKVEAKREECRDWLSAFAFVQLFRLPSGVPHTSKVLAWFGIEAVPVVLLFVLDLSFVRYQSDWITWEHHIIFVIDLVFLAWFNWQVFGGGLLVLWMNLTSFFRTLYERIAQRPGQPGTSSRERSPRTERWPWKILEPAWGAAVFCMALLLIFAAHPPSFHPETVREDRWGIWGAHEGLWEAVLPDGKSPFSENPFVEDLSENPLVGDQWGFQGIHGGFWKAVLLDGENPLDAGPCKWWRFACRYLDASRKRLVRTQTHEMSDKPGDESFATIDLSGRSLRFANFQSAQLQGAGLLLARLQGANLGSAQLQGADLQAAQLQGVDLQEAQLQGANLQFARLQGANLQEAQLQGADLQFARLQGADLSRVQLQGANLRYAQLQDVEFEKAQLQGANLQEAQLQGASLNLSELDSHFAYLGPFYAILSVFSNSESQVEDRQSKVMNLYRKLGRGWGPDFRDANLQEAQLQGADLRFAQLQGANLGSAQLQGVNLRYAQLQGMDLGFMRLQGADLGSAQLQGADLGSARLQGANLQEAQLQGANLQAARLQGADLQEAQLQGANLQLAQLQCVNLQEAQLQGADLQFARLQGSSGNPDSEHLVWAPGVSYDFPADKSSREEYLETLAIDETATVKLAWEPSVSLEEHLQKCMEKDQGPRVRLPDNHNQPDWDTWAEWTTEFACEDEYTARSSLQRWASEEPLSSLEGPDRAEAQKLVRKALVAARETGEECPGLHAISDDEWKEFIGS